MKDKHDAFGENLLDQYRSGQMRSEILEREDGYIDTGSDAGAYFEDYQDWSKGEQKAVGMARGRVLDVGCGAGRHSLYLQRKGFDVTAIDASPGAIKVCNLRGIKKAIVRRIEDVDKFRPASFDTVLMLGNNFGLFGSRRKARVLLKKLAKVVSPDGMIIAGSLDVYKTTTPDHLAYQKFNRRRGRMSGQVRFRIRYKRTVGKWFDYLLVSQDEMKDILNETDWRAEKFIKSFGDNYLALISKRK